MLRKNYKPKASDSKGVTCVAVAEASIEVTRRAKVTDEAFSSRIKEESSPNTNTSTSCDGALCGKAGWAAAYEDNAQHSTTEPQPPTPQHALKCHTNHLLFLNQLRTSHKTCTD